MKAERSIASTFFLWLGFLSGVGILAFTIREWGYYGLSLTERPLHPHAEWIRSSGYCGLSFGLAGTLLIFLNMTYLLRRSLVHISWLGALRSWMAFHVYTGLIGGALVLLHSTFFPKSVLGTLAFYSLAITVVTGVVGRFIYSHVPRSLEGRELNLEQIRKMLDTIKTDMTGHGATAKIFETVTPENVSSDQERGLFSSLLGIVIGDQEMRREVKNFKALIEANPALKPKRAMLLQLARRLAAAHQWLRRYQELRSLMGSWRFFHRWLAILMLVSVVFHIVIAVRLGELWILK